MGYVPYYQNEECYRMYIEARETEIKHCIENIKEAKKRIKNKEYYWDGLS